jgi:hypothetical protein
VRGGRHILPNLGTHGYLIETPMVSLLGMRITDGRGLAEVGKLHPGETTPGMQLMGLPRKEVPHLTENRKENEERKVTSEAAAMVAPVHVQHYLFRHMNVGSVGNSSTSWYLVGCRLPKCFVASKPSF